MTKLLLGLSLLLAATRVTAAPAEPAGTVAKVSGKVQVLRNPRDSVAPGGVPQARYDGKYWDAYDLAEGSKLFFGDLLSASPEGKTRVALDGGFNVILAPNAKLRLSRAMVKSGKGVVDLVVGALRARSEKGADETQTEFRSRSLVLGVRGTDFSMAALPKETQVVVVEGKVGVRNLDAPDAPEVVIGRGEATSVAVEGKAAPTPAKPATAAQARMIRAFSEGIAGQEEQNAVEKLVEEKEKPAPEPQKEPEPEEPSWTTRLAFEAGVGQRSVNNAGTPQVHSKGPELRAGVDYAPFGGALRIGFAVFQTELGSHDQFNDENFQANSASLSGFGVAARYAWEFASGNLLYGRFGIKPETLRLDGRQNDGSTLTERYDVGGLWMGAGYELRLTKVFALEAHLDVMPGSINSKEDLPADRNITKEPDGDAWSTNSIGLGLRVTPF